MNLKPEEISSIIKKQIETYNVKTNSEDIGHVISAGDGIARIFGLENCMYMEMLEFDNNIYGMALNLEEDNVGCVLFGNDTDIKEGSVVKRTGKTVEIPVAMD